MSDTWTAAPWIAQRKPEYMTVMRWDGTFDGAKAIMAWANAELGVDDEDDPWVDMTYHQDETGEMVVDCLICHTEDGPVEVELDDWVLYFDEGFWTMDAATFAEMFYLKGSRP